MPKNNKRTGKDRTKIQNPSRSFWNRALEIATSDTPRLAQHIVEL